MSRPRPRPLRAMLAVLASVVAASPAARPARACSVDTCATRARLAPADGSAIPASTYGLAWYPGAWGTDLPDALSLQRDDGEPATLSARRDGAAWMLDPEPNLAMGHRYTLRWPGSRDCPPGSPAGEPGQASFDAVALHVGDGEPGRVTVLSLATEDFVVPTARGSCTLPIPAMVARLAIRLPPSLEQFLPVLSLRTDFDRDDWEWSRSEYGLASRAPDGTVALFDDFWGGRRPDRVFARCGDWTDMEDNGLASGVHRVRVSAYVAGIDSPRWTSDEVTLDLTCPPALPEPAPDAAPPDNPGPDAPAADVPAPADVAADAPVDGRPDPGPPAIDPATCPVAGSSGCALPRGAPPAPPLALLLLALAAGGARRLHRGPATGAKGLHPGSRQRPDP